MKEDDIVDDVFCKIVSGEIPSKAIYEDNKVLVVMDVNPRSNGHVLLLSKMHYCDLFDIDNDDLNYIMKIAKKIANKLIEVLHCDGITLEQNNGIAQEVKHFHLHIIPRYINEEKMEIEDIYQKLIVN